MTRRQAHQQLLAQGEIANGTGGSCLPRPELRTSDWYLHSDGDNVHRALSPCSALAFRGGHMAVVVGVIFGFYRVRFFAVPAMFPGVAGTRNEHHGAELV